MKHHLLKDQRELKEALGKVHDWQLERSLITLPCIYGVHKKAADKYKQSSNDFDEVSRHYEKAVTFRKDVTPGLPLRRPGLSLTPGSDWAPLLAC